MGSVLKEHQKYLWKSKKRNSYAKTKVFYHSEDKRPEHLDSQIIIKNTIV